MVSNVQYRLSEVDGGTLIAFKHTALGFVSDEHKAGMNKGWTRCTNAFAGKPRAAAGQYQVINRKENRR
jgi:hypothetical protein